jgi:hypothetical protein
MGKCCVASLARWCLDICGFLVFFLLTHRIALSSVSLAYKESANCRECTNNPIQCDYASDSASTSDNTMSCVDLRACRAGG